MNYEKFCEELTEEVRRLAGEELQVRKQTVQKNNGVEADALEIRTPDSKFSPILYLEDFYEKYLRGVGIAHLAVLMMDCFAELRKYPPTSAELFEDYRRASSGIFCKLVNYEKNRSQIGRASCRERV